MVDINKEIGQTNSVERQRIGEELPTVESPRKSENIEGMSWMEKLERRFGRTTKSSQNDVSDDTKNSGDTVVSSKQPPVTLPITATQMQQGQSLPPEFSLAWMVIWAKRQIQLLLKNKRRVLFSPEKQK